MLTYIIDKVLGTKSERELKPLQPIVDKINSYDAQYSALSDDALKNKTVEFKERLAKGETTEDILPEAFATVREAAKRVIGLKHYDVQLLGGMVLHSGKISEMRTGEGKTLVATLPSYLNGLTGKGVHVVTVNDYLAIHSEKDVLKLVNTLIANTKGEGEKSAEDFWVKSERLFYTALIGYIWYEAPAEEMNFTTLLEMINASEAREDDPDFQSPVDLMFERLEQKDPDHFAVRQYKKFLLSAGGVVMLNHDQSVLVV
jgi:hypothetical protein